MRTTSTITTRSDELTLQPSFSAFESVSSPSYGHNAPGFTGIRLDLLPQPAYMDIHRTAVADKIPAPDALQDEFAREHLSLVLREEHQQFVLLWFQCQRFAIEGDFTSCHIDDQIFEAQFLLRFLGTIHARFVELFSQQAGTPQLGFDTRHQFTHGEGFGQVIICANLQTHNAVNFIIAGSQHEDWRDHFLAQNAADLEA